jgi:DNA replication protein DnaC
VQQERDEMEVLFTFFAARYERKSVIITSNLVFSQWDRIFKDAMTTAAAIDRLVHHSVILELVSKRSFRADAALERNDNYDDNYPEALKSGSETQGIQGTEQQPGAGF